MTTLLNQEELYALPYVTHLDLALADPEKCYKLKLTRDRTSQAALAEALPQLPRLQELTLWNNTQLETLPASLGNLPHLTNLNLLDCVAKGFASEITTLPYLIHLNIEGCPNWEVFPDLLRTAAELKFLAFNKTKVAQIPEWIGKLTHLTDLNVVKSQLQSLPDAIAHLPQLVYLNVYGNHPILSVPAALATLPALRYFNHSPLEVRGGTPESLKAALPEVTFRAMP